ncbi:MAG: helix-turn-helix domain-containing protein [Deltaproteobacteria bacterium]|nr:helix-turn-helix domain-containing protein [Deltaproteobacteria bacterium]
MTGNAEKELGVRVPPQLLRPTEAAKALGLYPQTLANLRHTGKGPRFVKLGAAVRYSTEALQDYVEKNTRDPRRAR